MWQHDKQSQSLLNLHTNVVKNETLDFLNVHRILWTFKNSRFPAFEDGQVWVNFKPIIAKGKDPFKLKVTKQIDLEDSKHVCASDV